MLFATSTSSVTSIVYEHIPSTSDGEIPASSSAATITSHASCFSDASSRLAKRDSAMPAIAVRSFSGASGTPAS